MDAWAEAVILYFLSTPWNAEERGEREERETNRHTDIDIQTYRHTDIQADRHTDIQTDRQTEIDIKTEEDEQTGR
jgi:hypothetical protein